MKVCMLSDGRKPHTALLMNAAIQAYILLDKNSLGDFAGEKSIGCQHLWIFSLGWYVSLM